MANYFEVTKLNPLNFVSFTSRYAENKICYYKEDRYLTFSTYKKNNYPSSSRDKYMVITKGYEYRPDLISQKIYGFPDYWWKIMEANNIKDIYNFKAGVNIRIPGGLF